MIEAAQTPKRTLSSQVDRGTISPTSADATNCRYGARLIRRIVSSVKGEGPTLRPQADRLILLAIALASLAVYLNALGGEFVYDDRKQILDNDLIQQPGAIVRALGADVWAFKGDRPEAWSNYWRPSFVAWLALNHRCFGLDSTLGWHIGSVALHALTGMLAYLLLRQIAVPRTVAASAVLVFAVHPAHVESVAWVSGAPDLLMAVSLLASWTLALTAEQRRSRGRRLAALGLFAVALLAKEAAVVFPLLLALSLALLGTRHRREVIRAVGPFAALAVAYLVIRWLILGRLEIETPWRAGPPAMVLTAPELLAFYLRQSFLPWQLGPSYPLRLVTPAQLGAGNFWLPLAVVIAAALFTVWTVRRSRGALLGAALFLLPLLPAMNVNAFIPEHLVHDRYLYLPLLGVWIVVFLAGRAALVGTRWIDRGVVLAALMLCPALAWQTVRYNSAWRSDVALWECGIRSDPTSAFNLAQYGNALLHAGRTAEARTALEQALALQPVAGAFIDRATIATREGRFADAERDLQRVVAAQPDNPGAYERLALVFERQKRLDEAAEVLTRGRDNVPYRRCAFTTNLAVVYYLAGRKAEALGELQSASSLVGRETTPACEMASFHLGSLLLELGRRDEAQEALRRYLDVSERRRDRQSLERREQARRLLAR